MAEGFEVVWQRNLHMRPQEVLARAADGVLITLERNTRLVRLDPLTGELRWEVKVEDPWGALALGEDVCVYVSQDGSMRCVDLASGDVRWVKPYQQYRRHLCLAPGALISGGWRGYRPLRGYDLESGDELWSRTDPGELRSSDRLPPFENAVSNEFHRPEWFGDGVLICPRGGRDLWLIDPRTGVVVDHWDLPEVMMADSDDRAFWPTGDGRVTFWCSPGLVVVLDPVEGVSVAWADPEYRWSGPQLLSGTRLWVARRRTISQGDIDTGVEKDLRLEGGPVRSAVIPCADGVFALSRAGFLMKYDRDGRVVSRVGLSRRAYALHSAATGFVHLAAKGSLVGVRTVAGSGRFGG